MDICRFHQLISITLLLCAGVTVAQEAPEGKSVAVSTPGNLPDPARRQIIESQARRYEELLHSGALDEAENLAKRRVELAISVSGTRSVEVADALTDLGIVQLRRQLYDAARQNFEAAVDMIIESENRLDA